MIDFVVLHYEAIEETNNCIETIKTKVRGKKRIIVVDNCSPNGSGKLLQVKYQNSEVITIILLNDNLGFAKANNIGFREAKKDNPDFIVVMNNDVFIQQDDFAEKLYKIYRKCSFDIMGPDIYSTRVNSHQNPQRLENYSLEELEKVKRRLIFKNKFKWMLKIKYLLPRLRDKISENSNTKEKQENVVLHGACYVFSEKFAKKYNGCFCDETFMYFESYILHYLAQKEGLLMLYDPSVKVLHHEDVATNLSYGNKYKKAVFVNRCLLDSCNIFIEIIKNGTVKLR